MNSDRKRRLAALKEARASKTPPWPTKLFFLPPTGPERDKEQAQIEAYVAEQRKR